MNVAHFKINSDKISILLHYFKFHCVVLNIKCIESLLKNKGREKLYYCPFLLRLLSVIIV